MVVLGDLNHPRRGLRREQLHERLARNIPVPLIGWEAPPRVRERPAKFVTQDATSGIFVPANATEWTGFAPGVSAPSWLWLCQEASGNLADSIGSVGLTAANTPLYAQTVSGWSRKGVGFTDASSMNFSSTSASLPLMTTTSMTVMAYVSIGSTAPSASTHIPFEVGSSTFARPLMSTSFILGGKCGTGTQGNGSISCKSTVFPLIMSVNVTATSSTIWWLKEKITIPYSALSASHGIALGAGGALALGCTILYACAWGGSAAEMSDQTIATLISKLNWTRAWNTAFTGAISESDSAPTDSVARVFVGGRTPSETVNAPTDSVSRAFSGFRAVSETDIAPTDVVTRVYGASRAPTESISVPADALARLFAGARSQSENEAAPSDAVARAVAASRSPSENLTVVADSAVRSATASRQVAEVAVAPADAVARVTGAVRARSESIGTPSDALTRAYLAVRGVPESTALPATTLVRVLAQSRAASEHVLVPADAASQVVVTSRAQAESLAAPADTVSGSLAAQRRVVESVVAPLDAAARSVENSRAMFEVVPEVVDQRFEIQTSTAGTALADNQGAASPSANQGAATPTADQGAATPGAG